MGKKNRKNQGKKNSKGSGQTSLKNDERNPPAHSEKEKDDGVSPESQSSELLECTRIFDKKIKKSKRLRMKSNLWKKGPRMQKPKNSNWNQIASNTEKH